MLISQNKYIAAEMDLRTVKIDRYNVNGFKNGFWNLLGNHLLNLYNPATKQAGWWQSFWDLLPEAISVASNGTLNTPVTQDLENRAKEVAKDDVGGQMFLWLGAASNSWSQGRYDWLASHYDMPWFSIVNDVLNNNSSNFGKHYYQNLLSKAECDGVFKPVAPSDSVQMWDTTYVAATLLTQPNLNNPTLVDTILYIPPDTIIWLNKRKHENFPFLQQNIFALPAREYTDPAMHNAEFNGLDYMFLHNLYKIAFEEDLTYTKADDNHCPCQSTFLQAYNQGTLAMRGQTEVSQKRFPEYDDYRISVPEFITHNVSALQQSQVQIAGDAVICDAMVQVFGNSAIEVLPSTKARPNELIVRNGGELRMLTNGTLIIGDNSKVIIKADATLRVNAGATIFLNGANAELVIEGELILGENATFEILSTATETGFVRFKKDKNANNGNETFARITAGTNSRINIVGESKDKAVLVIDGNFGVIVPQNLTAFTVSNGKIALGELSRLHVASPAAFSNVTFDNAEEGQVYFAGLITEGQADVSLVNCVFKNGYYGMIAENYLGTNNKPHLKECLFQNLIYGVRTTGGGIDIDFTAFTDNTFNLYAEGAYLASEFNDVHLTSGKVNYFTGNSTGVLSWFQGSVANNTEDGIITLGSTLRPRCVHFTSNNRYGIYAKRGSKLDLNSFHNGGFNNIKHNRKGIYSYSVEGDVNSPTWIGYGADIDLIDGYNYIDNNYNTDIEMVLANSSITAQSGNFYLETSKNYWGSANPPVVGQDYNLTWKPNWTSPKFNPQIETFGRHLTSSFQLLLAKSNGVCFNGFILPPQGGTDGRVSATSTKTVTDNGVLFGVDVHQAFTQASNDLFVSKDYLLAMQKFGILASENYTSLDDDDEAYLAFNSYRLYMESFSKLVSDTNTVDKNIHIQSAINKITTLQNATENSYWAANQVSLALDKVSCYRMQDNRLAALPILVGLLADPANVESVPYIAYYKCITEGEHKVKIGEINIAERLELYNCTIPFSPNEIILNEQAMVNTLPPTAEVQNTDHLLLSPNPAKTTFTVQLDEETKQNLAGMFGSIIVADGYGIPHIQLENIAADAVTNISLQGYKAGVYNIRFEIGGQVFYKYLVKTDE